jgi:hypothetical protein
MTGVVVSLTAGSSSGAGCSLDLWSGDISGAVTIGNLYVDGAITITDNVMTALVMTFEYTQPGLFDVTATIEYELNPDGSTRFFGTGALNLHIADAPLSLQAEVLALKPPLETGASTFQLVVASQSEPWSMFNDLFVLSEFALNANGIPPPGDAGLDLNNMEWDGTVFASGSFLGIDIVEANIAFTHLGVTDVSATLEAQMADLHLTADISVPISLAAAWIA